MMRETIDKALSEAISYPDYRSLIDHLLGAGKTTGTDHDENMLYYTQLNVARMNKWDKRFELSHAASEVLKEINKDEIWLVLTEAWCGDAAHALPVLAKMERASAAIDLKIVLRDEHTELMNQFLTNGARSIPKLIRLDARGHKVLDTWGPRPAELTALFQKLKGEEQPPEDIKKQLQIWYARNRGRAIENEIASMLMQKAHYS
ncbi:MAG: thioredoxin family protein [Owenweeksia sp.]|nr:thioredoxin family protein [Owenweeksia sp.]